MRKKIILTITAIIIVVIVIAIIIISKDNIPAAEDAGHEAKKIYETQNAPIQFENSEEGERPSFRASEYIKSGSYTSLKDISKNETAETFDEVSDAEIMAELNKRASDANITTSTLEDKDAAIISNQKYQTLNEYKAYLKKAISAKKAFLKKSDAFSEYIETLAENSEIAEIPTDLKEYEDSYVEDHLEERAKMFGVSLDQLKEQGMYDTFKETAIEQNDSSIKMEMYIKYIAEQEGLSLDDEDIDKMLEFYEFIYGWKQVEQMKASYTESQFETEALYYKIIITFF